MSRWTCEEATELCRKIEVALEDQGLHPALTGSCLYRDGQHRNADIMIYRKRSDIVLNVDDVFEALEDIGIEREERRGWCIQAATDDDKFINFLFPDLQSRKAFFETKQCIN